MQTKLGSLKESLTNIAIGFCVALAAQLIIFPLFGFDPPLIDNLAISALFTAVSLARSYVIRRWFNRASKLSYAQIKNEAETLTNNNRKIIELINNDLLARNFKSVNLYRSALMMHIKINNISNTENNNQQCLIEKSGNRPGDIKIDDELLPEFREKTGEA